MYKKALDIQISPIDQSNLHGQSNGPQDPTRELVLLTVIVDLHNIGGVDGDQKDHEKKRSN